MTTVSDQPYVDPRGRKKQLTVTVRRINAKGALEVEHHRFVNDADGQRAALALIEENRNA